MSGAQWWHDKGKQLDKGTILKQFFDLTRIFKEL